MKQKHNHLRFLQHKKIALMHINMLPNTICLTTYCFKWINFTNLEID